MTPYQTRIFNQIEKDFIDFIVQKRKRPKSEIEGIFLKTREKFHFSSPKFKKFILDNYELFKILYDDADEKEIFDSYRFHALLHLFRFISYSYKNKSQNNKFFYYPRILIETLARGDFKKILLFIKKILKKDENQFLTRNPKDVAEFLIKSVNENPVIVDYGCGPAYISFEIGKINKNAQIYLVDINSLVSEFTQFRFKKHGIKAEFIQIDENNLYPQLPACNICIATEVMEHIVEPLRAYQNIFNSLKRGAILYGDFSDHDPHMFHVSPSLVTLREKISQNFERINPLTYRKL